MTIQAKHFDTRLNQWIHTDGNTNNPDSLLKEELNNTLLEHFFPGVNFSFGHMDEKSTAEQLEKHPEGHKLLLSSKTRLLYGPSECLDTIRQLCPDNKDRGAYGSIFLGSCENAINRELNILIVDDSNGENGGIINNDQAYRLTGDCYGQISTELYHELTNHFEGDKYRVIQHRFGWTDLDGNDTKYRFGKGTLRPANLDQILDYQNPNNQTQVDLILPISAFKGTDKDNPNGPTKPQIQPGLYQQNIWLGEKSQSELGKTAISQLLASFPNGVKDFTEQLELEAKKLKEAQDDPRQLAQLYCEKYEKRKAFLEEQATTLEEQAESDPTVAEELETLRDRLTTDSFIYKLIKADLLGVGQLLETEKVQRELARFVQNEWKEIAIGKTLTFERAMVIPSKDLQNGEISIPHYQDGEQVLNFRSPFLNSNGLCVSTNKVVDDILGPDGKPLAGVIAVSDETSDRIYNRLNEQVKSILTEAQEKSLQIEGIENYLDKNIGKLETRDKIEFTNKFNEYITELQSAGYELEILPQESEQERQARDYDGDCIGFEQACKYPNLTAEALERNLPENAYDPTVKLKKQSFYQENGSQPEFEEIAIHMSDGMSVGVINNHLTSIEALESEITILKNFGSEKDQIDYVQQVAKHYEDLFKTEAWAKSKGIEGKEVPDKYRASLEEFVQNALQEPLTQDNALKAMSVNTKMYREMIAEAAFQNQIAVDLFKSAKKPEMEIIRNNSRILHREVNYIKDKKKDVYIDETIKPTGYSPVELLIAKTNQYFEKARLESRELVQFQDLFKGVEFSNSQRLQCTVAKKEFDESFSLANQLSREKETEKGPSANITLTNGNKVSVTNLLQYDSEFIWKANKITFKLSETPEEKRNSSRPHKYIVYAQINDETENGKPKFRALGTLAKEQENKLEEIGITPRQEVTSNKISFQSELSEGQIKLLYQKAYEAAEEFYNSIPEDQKLAMAAATWAVSTTRESSNNDNNQKKVSNFAFATFPKEIIKQLNNFQFTEVKITGFERNSKVFYEENQNQTQEIRFNITEAGKSVLEIKNEDGEYQTFGNIEGNSGRLPIGTTASAIIEKGEIYTNSVTTKIPGLPEFTLKVGEANRFELKDRRFHNEVAALTIERVNLTREDYTIYIQEGNKQEKLGNIDKDSLKEAINQGWLKEKPGEGQQLQLKIQSITTGQNAYAIGKTPEGKLLRINITNQKYKKKEINEQEYRNISVKAFDKKYVYIAKIGEQPLGIIGQHKERLERAFNNNSRYSQYNRQDSSSSVIQQLIDRGYLREDQTKVTIPVQITSNESTCKITINPEKVQYPTQWIKRSQLISNERPIRSEQQEKSNHILAKINERPTIMFQDEEQKLVGLVGLAVDEKLAERTKKYLEKVGVSYEQLPATQARLEAKKGMTVFMLDESTISVQLKQTFIDRAGGNIKSAVIPSQPAPIIPEQTVYFYNPNQQYSSADGSQVETKEAIGIVVPAQDAIAVTHWFESKSVDSVYFIENNTATFIITKIEINEKLSQELNALIGEVINIGEIDGFDRYEQLSAELNQKLETQDSLLPSNQTSPDSEYKQALLALPNRPKELSQSETPIPIVTAKPIEEEVKSTQPVIAVQAVQVSSVTKKLAENSASQAKAAETRKQVETVLQNSTDSLNSGQKAALVKMVAFSQQPVSGHDKDNEFLLTGYAGTGKTYVIQQLLKTLEQSGHQTRICFTAPTNSAVKVLREMAESQGIQAETKTTHSLLGLKEKYNELTGEVYYDRDKKERNNQHLKYDIVVVDEGSMVNKALYEKLQEIAKQGVKIIYMGDKAQLPPVGEPESPIFQIENCADLTEVMRYGGDIGKTAETIRNNLDTDNPELIRTCSDGTIVAVSKEEFKNKVTELFSSLEFKQDNSSIKVIAYTNSRVDQINALVKEQLFGKDSPEYVSGMRIIARESVTKDNGETVEVLLHNSEEMTITEAEQIQEGKYKVWKLQGNNEENLVVEFKVIAQESKEDFKKDADRLWKQEFAKPVSDRNFSIPVSFQKQYSDIRPAYAITVHNSQGKTIKKGLVDETNINYRLKLALQEQDPEERARGIKEHNQLRYVAMTRFKEQVFVLSAEREREVEALKLQQAKATLKAPTSRNPSFGEQPQGQTNSKPLGNTIETPGNGNQLISLPSSNQADQTKAIEILGKISPEKVETLKYHLESHLKPLLEEDKSNYAPGRQVAWVGAKWDLKDKDFKPGVQDDALMQLVKQVYPDANIALVTYSQQPGTGIGYHRDDSYAALEARSINIGNSEWGYRAAKEQMAWTKEENTAATYQEFKLESGTVTRFNCKNEHAAINTEAGRWSINIWSIKNDHSKENSVRAKFENFLASNQPPRAVVVRYNDLTIKGNEWTPGGEIKVERSYNSLKEATQNTPASSALQPSVEELIAIGNQTTARAANPQIPENPTISGKPVPMVYSLHMHCEPNLVPVNTTIDAMRGHGRVHTTRGLDYQKTYGIKEGDIAVALGKNGSQVAFRVGKQYEITSQMIQDPAYQQAWANWEKHSAKELTQTQASKSKVYGLFMEPLGDYVNGKIVPFPPVQKQTATSLHISPDSKDGLLAALANATVLAKEQGTLQNDYQVWVNNNPEAAAGRYGVETHLQKPEGVAYASAEHAFNHLHQLHPRADEYKLMVEVLQAKLEQHSRLIDAIAKRGGVEWLENCTNITNAQDKQWEGKGKESAFIRALTEAYSNVVEAKQEADVTFQQHNPKSLTTQVQPSESETVTPTEQQKAERKETSSSNIAFRQITVISGGQTGADMGGLIGAASLGLPTGGTAAAGYITEAGSKKEELQKYGLKEGERGNTTAETYDKRTIENIRNSDGTAIFGDVNSPGSRFTAKVAQSTGKPILHVTLQTTLNQPQQAAEQLRNFVESNNIQVLNVAGNRESFAPGLQVAVAQIVEMGLAALRERSAQTNNQSASSSVTNKTKSLTEVAPGINLNSRSQDPLGAALTSTTVKSKQVNAIVNDYPVSFRDNKAMPAGTYGPETYTQPKAQGEPFLSAEQVFYAYKETVPFGEPRIQLMAEIQLAKLEQHPKLVEAITERGGTQWLDQCNYYVSNGNSYWEGKGQESPFIRALTQAYINVQEKIETKEQLPTTAATRQEVPQKTDIEQAFTSKMPKSQVGVMDATLERIKQNTVQSLNDWYEAAQKLGKSQKYLNRIQSVKSEYINEGVSLENAFKAMSRDIKELEKINEVTSLAQRIVKTVGTEDINGIMSVKTENYKNYQIATKVQEQTYLIKDKDDNVVLYVKGGKTQTNNISNETLLDFRFMNYRIENSLNNVKKELVEK